jgi:copper(I)-binding protein
VTRLAPAALLASALASLGLTMVALAGCQGASAAPKPVQVGGAYVIESGGLAQVDAYLVIRNPGAADQLLRVTSSAGGTVVLRGPRTPLSTSARSVSKLEVPARTMLRLTPNGIHLVILHSGPIHPGGDVTLTLVFARAGTVRVAAQVTNLQRGAGG